MFETITRTSTSGAVFDQIASRVLAGDLSPGENLPSERRLAEAFGVSRTAVREAIQKLTQAGLVEVRQGDATSVRDFRRHAGPELLPELLAGGGTPNWKVARSVVEARHLVGAQVASLAARRSSPQIVESLDGAVTALAADPDPVAQQLNALAFWEVVVDAADSLAFRLIFNSLRNAYLPMLKVLATVLSAEVSEVEHYRRLAHAIGTNNEASARAAAEELLGLGTASLTHVIDTLDQP